MVIILPQGGQLQNYLKLDLGELENHLWAHVESKSSTKKLPGNIGARMARNWTVLSIGRVAYHAFIHHFISSYAVLLSFFFFSVTTGKFIPDRRDLLLRQRRHVLLEVGLKSSFFFSTPLVINRDELRRTFVLFLVRRIRSRVLASLRLPENVCKAPAMSLISVRSFRSRASFQRACISFLGDPVRRPH